MAQHADVKAWRPRVAGIREVLHARFVDHAYPSHTHDAWTLLIVDDGVIRFGIDRHEHGVLQSAVTLLPPHVPHDGRTTTPQGFRKRVLYLEPAVLDAARIGAAVDRPVMNDPLLRRRVGQLHEALAAGTEDLEGQSRLAFLRERLGQHLMRQVGSPWPRRDPVLARRLRALLDDHVREGVTLDDAAGLLQAHPAYLVRVFTQEYGIPPHLYLTGRRVDLARSLLLDGARPAEVAVAAGFYDQSHLTRHFRRMLGTSPARYANSAH